ncbi:MAG: glycosyltransferase family 2 protein [Chloroflexi bacterium]|nr:glycosyltransferase family 2 protein [Chloroflexota bacterium]
MASISKPLIWIVIVNWNGLQDTLECLDSLSQLDKTGFDVQTIVFDNASAHDPRWEIQLSFPEITVLRMETNIGFAPACNLGISMAMDNNADYVLLLNNDTFVHPHFLRLLLIYALSHPNAGIVAPVICYASEPENVWFAGARAIFALGYFEHQHMHQNVKRLSSKPVVTDYVSGCCMLISGKVIKSIGSLDGRYFAYFEDVDYCMRARRAGFESVYLPQSIIWHKESASTRRGLDEGTTSPLKHYLMIRNRIVTEMKHASWGELLCFLLIGNTITAGFYLTGFALKRRWGKMIWFSRGLRDGILQRFENSF